MQIVNGFATKVFIVFTNCTTKFGPINNLINSNGIYVIILMIFIIRLSKTEWFDII